MDELLEPTSEILLALYSLFQAGVRSSVLYNVPAELAQLAVAAAVKAGYTGASEQLKKWRASSLDATMKHSTQTQRKGNCPDIPPKSGQPFPLKEHRQMCSAQEE